MIAHQGFAVIVGVKILVCRNWRREEPKNQQSEISGGNLYPVPQSSIKLTLDLPLKKDFSQDQGLMKNNL